MKKIILASVFSIFSAGVFAQSALDAQLRDAQCKTVVDEIAKAEKTTADAKKGLKSANWVKLAEAYLDMSYNCGKDSLASEKAYNTYKKALEVDKAAGGKGSKEIEAALIGQKLHDALMSQGANYYNAKNIGNSFRLFKLATDVKNDSTTSLYAGITAQQLQDNANAIKYLSQYLDLGGKDASVYYSIAQIYKAQKDIKSAIAVLKRGVAANPNDKDLKGEIVNMNLSSGNSDEAINELKKLVDADPTNLGNLLNLGILYNNAGDAAADKAKKITDKASPDIAKFTEEAKAKRALALDIYKQVIAKDPKNYDANFNLGVLYFNQAVEMKGEVDKMDMKTYQKEGKAVEDRVCAKFAEAKVFFDVCKSVKPDDGDLKSTYDGLVGVLDQCSKRK